jgi:predicted permease
VGLASLATAWCTAKIGPLLANDGIDGFTIDGRVLAFALLASMATAIVFGVLPALRGSRVDVAGTLKEGAGGLSSGASRMRLTGLLVTVEVALSVVLVTSGGLLLNSIREYWRFDWGIPLDHRMAMQVTPIERNYDTDSKLLRFYGQLLARARELPGVESAALVNSMPLHMGAYNVPVRAEGPEPIQAGYRVISPGYHSTAGLALRTGRSFSESDSEGRPQVALISESLASKLWPGGNAIGSRLQVNGDFRTVVGITADVPQDLLKKPNYEVSVPYLQAPPKSIRILVRVPGDPAAAAAALRTAVRSLDPDLPLGEIQTLRATKEQLGARFEFIMVLLCSFAVSALVLAVAGIYGVTSRAVAIRTREIGIRIALGADPRRVVRQVLKGGLKLALAGTVVGSLLSLMMIKVLLSKIWWMSPVSSFAWIAPVALLMALLAVTASLQPARRATRIATVLALRAE